METKMMNTEIKSSQKAFYSDNESPKIIPKKRTDSPSKLLSMAQKLRAASPKKSYQIALNSYKTESESEISSQGLFPLNNLKQ